MRILLAVADEGLRRFLKRYLRSEDGLAVVGEALDGPEAVHKAGLLKPDVAVIDMDLPGLNVLDVIRRIKTARPTSQVLLLSAVEGKEYREAAARSGVDAYLLKTASVYQFLTTIRKLAPLPAA